MRGSSTSVFKKLANSVLSVEEAPASSAVVGPASVEAAPASSAVVGIGTPGTRMNPRTGPPNPLLPNPRRRNVHREGNPTGNDSVQRRLERTGSIFVR